MSAGVSGPGRTADGAPAEGHGVVGPPAGAGAADDAEPGDDADPVLGTRWPELAVSGLLVGVAALVIVDSLRVGIGWADDGPRSGYFPFATGLLLLLSAGAVFIGQLLRWRERGGVFARRSELGLVAAVWLPMVAFVALVFGLGLYVSAALLIGYFMRRHGSHRWATTAAVALGVPLLCFLVFERWFLVPLPKGPLERWVGL